MIFTTHDNNIPQIKAVVNTFGGCWIHGDGNLYADDSDGTYHSTNQKEFSNPKNEEKMYRAHFKRGDKLPKSKEELDRMLMASRNQEILAQRHVKEVSNVRTFAVADTDFNEPEGEIDFSKYARDEANVPAKQTKAKK